VLLVILIFLMLTTTYSKFTELQLTLPVADAEQQRDHPKEVIVAVAADGRYAVNKAGVEGKGVDAVARRCAAPPAPAATAWSSSAQMPRRRTSPSSP
jgi:biopolymer transport protein ExbD